MEQMYETNGAMSSTTRDTQLNLDALARAMVANGLEVTGGLTANRVGLGQSNLTYTVGDQAGRRWIARRPPLGRLLESAHDVVREHRILSALQSTDVPVPAIHGVYQGVSDVPVVVIEYVDGVVVDTIATAEALPCHVRDTVGRELACTLAQIHQVDLQEAGLLDLASHSSYAARQLKRWSRQWESSRTRDLPELDAMTALLHRTMPEREELRLVHGDFHLRNVVIDPATGAVRAALDWELSTLGDPLADIGSLLAYWPIETDPAPTLFGASALPGFVDRQTMARTYVEASGRDPAGVSYWHVLGLWKIAVICEGVRRRTSDTPANAASNGPPPSGMVEQLVAQAWAVARDAGLDRNSR